MTARPGAESLQAKPIDLQRIDREVLKLQRRLMGKLNVCSLPIVVPTEEFFDFRIKSKLDFAQHAIEKLAAICDLRRRRFRCCEDAELEGELIGINTYRSEREGQRYRAHVLSDGTVRVGFSRSALNNRKLLLGTITQYMTVLAAREYSVPLGHAPRSWFLIDLCSIHFGLGVLSANAAFEFNKSTGGGVYRWSVHTSGVLSEAQFGYGLALYAEIRGEVEPSWKEHLDPDVRASFHWSVDLFARIGLPKGIKRCVEEQK